jgi:hypothetical protein
MMAEKNLDAIQDNPFESQVNSMSISLQHSDWYADIIFI